MLNRRSLLKTLAAIPFVGPILPKAAAGPATFQGVPLLWEPTLGPPGPPYIADIDWWSFYTPYVPETFDPARNWVAIDWKCHENGDDVEWWQLYQRRDADYVLSSAETLSLIQACISCRSAFGPVMEDSEMLCLTRKLNEVIKIGDGVTVTVLRVDGNKVRLGIQAPDHVEIVRGELLAEEENQGGNRFEQNDNYGRG